MNLGAMLKGEIFHVRASMQYELLWGGREEGRVVVRHSQHVTCFVILITLRLLSDKPGPKLATPAKVVDCISGILAGVNHERAQGRA